MDGMFERHTLPSRWFEDFYLGERFVLPTRTMSPDLFRCFADASGETHPLHTETEYCLQRGMPAMLAHGMMVAIQTVAGAGLFPFMIEESLVRPARSVEPVRAARLCWGRAASGSAGDRTRTQHLDRRHRAAQHRAQPESATGP